MITCNWKCPVTGCQWDVDPSITNSEAYSLLLEHFHESHNLRRGSKQHMFENFNPKTKGYAVETGAPIGMIARVEIELDNYIKKAMEWPAPEGGVWDSNELAKLRNELEKAKATAAGRGLAIALWHMHGAESISNKYKSPDAVIKDAVERYRNPVPADSANGQTPAEALASGGQTQQMPPAPKLSTKHNSLTAAQKESIATALSSGFTAEQLSDMMKIPVEVIKACKA